MSGTPRVTQVCPVCTKPIPAGRSWCGCYWSAFAYRRLGSLEVRICTRCGAEDLRVITPEASAADLRCLVCENPA